MPPLFGAARIVKYCRLSFRRHNKILRSEPQSTYAAAFRRCAYRKILKHPLPSPVPSPCPSPSPPLPSPYPVPLKKPGKTKKEAVKFPSQLPDDIHAFSVRPSSGTMASVFPSGARTLRTVSSCGLVIPRSIRAMIGCLTPLNSSSLF